ncbi:CD209 antigen-like protein C isoform X3 [Paroedura picta]|uniref:CD209 antigen-like protein C isoform X3 n=1 Tax=Paroedura picta TaxID=143630 RepID=UPI004056BEC9
MPAQKGTVPPQKSRSVQPSKKDGISEKGTVTPKKSLSVQPSKKDGISEKDQAPSFGKRILASTLFISFIVLLTIVLICGAVAMLRIYPEILEEAAKLLDILDAANKRNEWAESQIKPIRSLLGAGWKAFQGHLYFVSNTRMGHQKAREACEKANAYLVIINTPEEEDFVEKLVQLVAHYHWIGLKVVQVGTEYEWQWLNGEKPVRSYWMYGMSTRPEDNVNNCAAITQWCSTPRICWRTVPCGQWHMWVCKMPPNPELMD